MPREAHDRVLPQRLLELEDCHNVCFKVGAFTQHSRDLSQVEAGTMVLLYLSRIHGLLRTINGVSRRASNISLAAYKRLRNCGDSSCRGSMGRMVQFHVNCLQKWQVAH